MDGRRDFLNSKKKKEKKEGEKLNAILIRIRNVD